MARAKILETDELARVLDYLTKTSRYPERDVAAMLLSHKAALRVGEIAALKWSAVLDASGRLADRIDIPRTGTKGQKRARIVAMHTDLKAALEALREAFPERCEPNRPVIFTERGNAYGSNALAQSFGKWYRGAGLKGCSSHSGRRTAITNMARKLDRAGASIKDVQAIAGHSDFRTTAIYIDSARLAQSKLVSLI